MIGHASIDENGNIKGGRKGDQTKKEVCMREWYDNGWTTLIRAKSKTLANKIAKNLVNGGLVITIAYNEDCTVNELYYEAKCMVPETGHIIIK